MKRRVFVHFVALSVTCMIFDQTRDLFKRWLMYGIGTIFSVVPLSVMASMVLGLTVRVSAALWGAKIINSIMACRRFPSKFRGNQVAAVTPSNALLYIEQ